MEVWIIEWFWFLLIITLSCGWESLPSSLCHNLEGFCWILLCSHVPLRWRPPHGAGCKGIQICHDFAQSFALLGPKLLVMASLQANLTTAFNSLGIVFPKQYLQVNSYTKIVIIYDNLLFYLSFWGLLYIEWPYMSPTAMVRIGPWLKFQQLYTIKPRYNKPTSSNIILWGIFIFASITSGTSKTHRLFSLSLLQPHGPSHYLSMATSFAKGYPPLIQRSPGTFTYIHYQWRFIAGEII